MKNRYSKLLGNSFIFVVANLGTKMMQFVMVPLYTYVLSKVDFGLVDLIMTTVTMLAPMASLSIYDAVFRFSMDAKSDKKTIFTTGIFITLIGTLIIVCVTPILKLFHIPFLIYAELMLITTLFINLLQNFARASGFIKLFAFSGLVSAVGVATLNVLFLVVFHFGVYGYIASIIISLVITLIYLSIGMKIWNYFNIKLLEFSKIKRMLKYSVPLIPNAFSWWLTNDANKYFILFFVGASGNGLYAVANKVPSVLSTLFNVFNQAWQMSAVEEFDSDDSGPFYSRILDFIISLSFLGISGILIILKPFMSIFTSTPFYVSWKLVPFLLVAACYSNISAFYGTVFIAQEKTSAIFTTTIFGMFTNLTVNLLLIPIFGVNGAGIGSSLGFLSVWIIRIKLVNKVMTISLNKIHLIIGHILVAIMIAAEYLQSGTQLFMIEFVIFILFCVMFRKELLIIFNYLWKALKIGRKSLKWKYKI